jgi:uncharacterized protein YcgI (DUF1989 family)
MTTLQSSLVTIPARQGKATYLTQGQSIKVINPQGSQVVDTWAFNTANLSELMSMEHTRALIGKIIPKVGDTLYTNCRRPILTLTEDTSPGIHDTLIAACDRYRYELLGVPNHDNCTDNLFAAMAELSLTPTEVPSPLNLFMNIPVTEGLYTEFVAPVSRPGDFVVLKAEMDCVVAFSACPQDIVPVNGVNCQPSDVLYEII